MAIKNFQSNNRAGILTKNAKKNCNKNKNWVLHCEFHVTCHLLERLVHYHCANIVLDNLEASALLSMYVGANFLQSN